MGGVLIAAVDELAPERAGVDLPVAGVKGLPAVAVVEGIGAGKVIDGGPRFRLSGGGCGWSCRGGGNLEMIDSKLSGEIAKAKIDEVTATEAKAVVTACQQCVRTMNTYVRRNKLSLEVMDIVQLVQKALGK